MEPVRAPFFNGLWLSVASFNTGGMTSMSTGMLYYHSGLVELVVMVLTWVDQLHPAQRGVEGASRSFLQGYRDRGRWLSGFRW